MDMDINLDYDPYKRGYYTARPKKREKATVERKHSRRHEKDEAEEGSDEEFELKWHVADGKYDFPKRQWGEDPDHFNFNNGGLESHNRYNKPLDYDDIIRPNEPKRERRGRGRGKKEDREEKPVLAHKMPEEPEALTTDFNEFVRDRDAHYGERKRRSSRREEPIPDAYDYSTLDWAVEKFKKDHHQEHDAPELKVKKNPYSRFSYLKSAADFGDEGCVDCEHEDSHPLDKPDEVPARREFAVEKREKEGRAGRSHRQDPIEPTLTNRDLVRDFDAWTLFNPAEDEEKDEEKPHSRRHSHKHEPIPEYAPVGRFF